MSGSGTQIAADDKADSLAALATSKSIHQKILIRLFWGWLLLCVVIGGAVFWLEVNRFQQFVHELALKESALLSSQFSSDLQERDNFTEQSLTDLAQQLVDQHFLIVELYDLNKQLRIEAIRSGEEATERWIDRYRHQFPRQGEFFREFHFTDGRLLLVMLVPLTGGGNIPVGYFEGIYQVDQRTMDSIKYELLRTLFFVTISITFTTILMYPVILVLNRGLIRLSDDLLKGNLELMNVLGCAIAERDADTNSHNYRVTCYALRLGEAIALPHAAMRNLIMGAFLHDVGKIGIRDPILLKPGKLTPQEYEIMKTHISLGVDILNQSSWISGARDVVKSHHEKYDGSGYLQGLKGEAIPLNARIFAIADVFDALTSRRPYKTPWPVEQAIHFLVQKSSQHFDPGLVDIFVVIAPAIYDELHSMPEKQMVSMLQQRIARHFVTIVT
ncbi:HD domain-containing protein [Nitrosomonas aestuarii]|uniref:HD domain-containing protein n=1 Tax=Nitrosomonas aestuarii TaxID=52441 RepID=A0A1I3XS52_9PROT|nr:HD domain-containing phosphohydrolase [Nitrosomonas aestuarii]SFK22487.1 HD domain-containing protein [Nitrosomonas aestuarii]